MQTFFKLSFCIGVLAFFSACEKQGYQSTAGKTGASDAPRKSVGTMIESHLNYDDATTLGGIASIKFQAGRIPVDHSPDPGYTAPDLGDLSIEEVIYFLEATCNYDANQGLVWSSDHTKYRTTFSIPFITGSSDLIDQDDVVDAYDNLYDVIGKNAPAGSQAFACNIWGISINPNDADFEIEIAYLLGEGGSTVEPLSPEDRWMAFNGWGKCFQSSVPGDATTRLEELVNWYGVQGWGGSSSTSTGGLGIVCTNGWPGTFVNSISLPQSNYTSYYHENGDPAVWPLTSCTSDLCLYPADMEDQLVDFFNYTSNSILVSSYQDFEMIYAIYTNHSVTPDEGEYCYEWSVPQYRHQVRWDVGKRICGPLPW